MCITLTGGFGPHFTPCTRLLVQVPAKVVTRNCTPRANGHSARSLLKSSLTAMRSRVQPSSVSQPAVAELSGTSPRSRQGLSSDTCCTCPRLYLKYNLFQDGNNAQAEAFSTCDSHSIPCYIWWYMRHAQGLSPDCLLQDVANAGPCSSCCSSVCLKSHS